MHLGFSPDGRWLVTSGRRRRRHALEAAALAQAGRLRLSWPPKGGGRDAATLIVDALAIVGACLVIAGVAVALVVFRPRRRRRRRRHKRHSTPAADRPVQPAARRAAREAGCIKYKVIA